MIGVRPQGVPSWFFVLVAGGALVVVLLGRILGPTDLYHQTQPKTVSYTTDMIVNGEWVLPHDHMNELATKPPLYNWLAVPFVRFAGFSSEIAHKAPSMIALVALCVVLLVTGSRLGEGGSGVAMGGLAVTMVLANYSIFKLGYLARPDMLLTLWLFVAWVAGTAVFVRIGDGRVGGLVGLRLVFWVAVGLAWLTKGPAGLLPLLYAPLAARLVAGRWSHTWALWWWGLPLAMLPFLLWIGAVWSIDRHHLVNQLLWHETVGRFVGAGSEAAEEGVHAWYLGAGHMLAYFFARSAPWSLLSCAAVFVLWKRLRSRVKGKSDDTVSCVEAWMLGAATWTVLVVVLFTLSAGKRADYIAPGFPTGALLASWWWLRFAGLSRGATVVVTLVAGVALTGVVVSDEMGVGAPLAGQSPVMRSFISEATTQLSADELPVYHRHLGLNHVPAFLGWSSQADPGHLLEHIRQGESFWLIEGSVEGRAVSFSAGPRFRGIGAEFVLKIRSEPVAASAYWPGVVSLYRVEPGSEIER